MSTHLAYLSCAGLAWSRRDSRQVICTVDLETVRGLVAFNRVFQLLFFGVCAGFFLAVLPPLVGLEGRVVDVSFTTVAGAVFLDLGVPFAAGFLAQRGEARDRQRFLPRIAPITLAALPFSIVAMFALKGGGVLRLPLDALRIAVPLAIHFVGMFLVRFWMGKLIDAD